MRNNALQYVSKPLNFENFGGFPPPSTGRDGGGNVDSGPTFICFFDGFEV